ncbi:MAG: helix-turn-helix domain-containing protein [Chloroflexia bacterium]
MSRTTLTVGDLLLRGEPLDPAEVLAGESRLSNAVSWVVSLRPYPPAFPRLRGGELALVAAEHIARLDPPTTLASVVAHLASRDAAGVAVRGEVDQQAREAASAAGLPLLQLADDAQLPDIEQAIMRECALYLARREMTFPGDPLAWIDAALEGILGEDRAALEEARRSGYEPSTPVSIGLVAHTHNIEANLAKHFDKAIKTQGTPPAGSLGRPLVRVFGSNLVVILPVGYVETLKRAVRVYGVACGISDAKTVQQAKDSLAEAEMSLLASQRLYDNRPIQYADMGADRLLLLLLRDRPMELKTFVEQTLGPLLRHDASSASPLLPTVRSFVEHGGRLRETASQIYVHRNTLTYRLDRAAELLGANLKEPRARLAIELALRALPLLEL